MSCSKTPLATRFDTLYSGSPLRLKQFLASMTGISLGAAKAIAAKFPWKQYKTFIDVGCAQGGVPVQVALAHNHLTGGGFDLPVVQPIFAEYVASFDLQSRLKFFTGDFMKGDIPQADVLIMGHILHDWDLEQKKLLVAKAYRGLHPSAAAALLVYDAIIDDDRSKNAFGLLTEPEHADRKTPAGFDYTGSDCCRWLKSMPASAKPASSI